jgi:hypothetical protein
MLVQLLRSARGARGVAVALMQSGVFAAACGAQEGSDLVVSSDSALSAIVAELLPDLARRSGMELREPVRVEKRSREDLVRYLERKLDEELPEDEARAIVDAYALLGLVPADLDLRGVLMSLYTEQVSGFYEPDSTALFVMNDQPEADVRGLLVHELVHAVQDQSEDLVALTDPDRGSDRATAAQAAIEGHATLVMFEYMAEEQMGSAVDLSQIPGFGPMLRENLQGIRTQFPVLASAPRIVQETLIFPYLEGAVFLQQLWSGGDRVVPFGDDLPTSTEQILVGLSAAPPIELLLEIRGGDSVREDVLGRLELGVLLEEHAGTGAGSVADAWEGDRYALVEGSDGQRVLVSHVLWEDEAARDRFLSVIGANLGAFGAEARVEPSEIDGRPASILTVGEADGITVRVSGTERR